MRTRGVALPTALFLVLVLFAMITAAVVQVRQDLAFTASGHRKTQAVFLSHAALSRGHKEVAQRAEFVDEHLGRDQAFLEGDEISVWFERHPDHADVYYMFGLGVARGVEFRSVATLKKKEASNGVVYARRALDGPDVLYYRTPGATDWSTLPPAPRRYWKESPSGPVQATSSGSVPSLRKPVGDFAGGLYAVWQRDGIDSIFRYDRPTNAWSLMPPPPKRHRKKDGTLVESPGQLAGDIDDLATDGKGTVYARTKRDGVDTIHHYDPGTEEWSALPAAPGRVYKKSKGGVKLVETGEAAGSLTDLAADGEGNLVARQPREGIDTIYRYDAEEGRWDVYPEVPKVIYQRTPATGEIDPKPVKDEYVGSLSALSMDRDGTVYGRYGRDGVDTLYRFDGTGRTGPDGRLEGAWSLLAPPPRTVFNKLGEKTGPLDTEGDESEGGAGAGTTTDVLTAASGTAVDSEGRLYLVYSLKGRPDSMIVIDDGEYEILPPIPRYRYKDGRLTLDGGFESRVDDVAGGALGAREEAAFVPVSTY